MGLSCCKKILIENRAVDAKEGKIKIEFDDQFEVPIVIIEIDGFLTLTCRLWTEMIEKKEESPEYLKKFPSVKSLDTVF